MDQRLDIEVNGQRLDVAAGTTLAELLEQLELDSRSLAVERNLELVTRTRHAETLLMEGDRLEVVTLVGGG